MENTTTVRIDIQRLQILNDRLCQTLDALNQVRLSAHAQVTGYAPSHLGAGYTNPYLPQNLPVYQNPYQTLGYAPAFTGVYGQPQVLPTQISNPWLAACGPVVNPFINGGIFQGAPVATQYARQPISAFGTFGAVQPVACY